MASILTVYLNATEAKNKNATNPVVFRCSSQKANIQTGWFSNEPIVKHITSHGGSIAQAEEGACTKMAGTVAANSNLLNLVDCDIAGPGFEGYHLCERDRGEATKRGRG